MIPNNFINRNISILYRYGQRILAHKLKSSDLPLEVGQIPFIMQVYRNSGITQEGISTNAVMDKGTTARGVMKLEKAGLVRREVSQNDKRVNHIYPTEKAMEIQESILKILKEVHDILYKGLSPEEIDLAISLLNRMKDNISGQV